MNLAMMMKQAQQMQKRLQDAQKELDNAEVTAEAADGAVVVVCNGTGKFKSIKLTKKAINAENPDSVDDETDDASKKMQDKMKGIVPAGINIPGLF